MIRLEKVEKVYWEGLPAEVRALSEVDLHVGRGEHVAVLTWRGSPAYEFTAWVECRSPSTSAAARR